MVFEKDKIQHILNATWFDLEDENEDDIILTTRNNGSVFKEEAGEKDILEAMSLVEAVNKTKGYIADYNTCDEWVSVYIHKKK